MTVDVVLYSPTDASAGCAGSLDDPAAGCLQAPSEDDADESKHVNDRGAGCAQAEDAAADQAAPKTRPTTLREFEHALRTLGFSKAESVSLARDGFKALAKGNGVDQAAEFQSLRQAIERRASALNTER